MKFIANPVQVTAWDIVSVAPAKEEDGSLKLTLNAQNADETPMIVSATPDMLARITPVAGDYWVVQDDGYTYLNPKAVFEKKYALDEVINPEDKLDRIEADFKAVAKELAPEKITRELALALTKMEEATLWVRQHVTKNT